MDGVQTVGDPTVPDVAPRPAVLDPETDRVRGFGVLLAFGSFVALTVLAIDSSIYLQTDDISYLVFAVLALFVLVAIAVSLHLIRRGQVELGVAVPLAYLLAVAPVGPALVEGRALVSVSLPFIAMAVAMTYASVRHLRTYGIASWASAVLVLGLWQWHSVREGSVPWSYGVMNTMTAAVVVAFTFYALSRYSRRLNSAFAGLRDANRDLKAAHEELQGIDAARMRFMNTAAHELNTPMTPITLQLRFLSLSSSVRGDPAASRSVAVLERNFERLRRLAKDILDGARIDAGHLEVRELDVDMSRLLAHAVEDYAGAAASQERRLVSHVEPGLFVVGDPVRLRQVVDNLLSNALKFTAPGGLVELGARATDGDVLVTVRDDGIGIPPAAAAWLFQPFRQVHDPTKVATDGSGLGLYLARGIAERHGGTLELASDGPGTGTTFTLRIPLRRAQAVQAEAVQPLSGPLRAPKMIVPEDRAT
jgi:signal transduction histidine kinase